MVINKKYLYIGAAILIAVGLFLGGFFLGRGKIRTVTKETVKYIKGDTVKISVPDPYPIYVQKPVDSLGVLVQLIKDGKYSEMFPKNVDTLYLSKTDSSEIVKDWATLRRYNEKLFDSDTLGTCSIIADVQYNELKNLKYTYVPMVKVVEKEVYTIKKFSPFIGVGGMSNPSANAMAGFYINEKYGFAGQYQYNFDMKKHTYGGMVFIKF